MRGRGFNEQDRGPGENAIVLSESLARRLFPDGNRLGRRLHIEGWSTVIGIAADVRNNGPAGAVSPEYYMPRKHTPDEVFRNQMPPAGWRQAKVAIRTPANPHVMGEWIKHEIAAIDPTLPVAITTMQQRVSRLSDQPRFNAVLLSLFAGMGVLLASIGLYGVMAFLVGQRTQEIGVRMALGANPRAISKLVLRRAVAWTMSGAILGVTASLFIGRWLRSLLFEIPERDPWTLGVVLPCLFVIALAAAWVTLAAGIRASIP